MSDAVTWGEQTEWENALVEVGSLLEPSSVAVVGASNTEGKPGNVLLKNIKQNGFTGSIYPINPNDSTVLGLEAYTNISDVPEDLDTAIFAVPGQVIKNLIPDCAEKNVTSIVIVSAGFAEAVDNDRQRLQKEIAELCDEYGIRAVGPNTTGMVSMKENLVASFMPFPKWYDGNIGLAAQTGIFAGVYMEELMSKEHQRLGYNYSIGLGNKIDIDETDFVMYAGQDEEVDVIQMYLECIRHPDEFFSAASQVAEKKPIVLLKSGRTREGRNAARWHTSSTPSLDSEIDNACQSCGVVRAETVPEFMNYAKGFAYQPTPKGRNVAVLSLSGANAVMTADYISQSRLELAELTIETLERVKNIVPDWQPLRNPIDQWLALPNGAREAQAIPLNAVLSDPNVDAVITIHLASGEPNFSDIGEVYNEAMVEHQDKPVLSYIMGSKIKDEWIESMEKTSVPVYDSAYAAVDTLESMYWWYRHTDGVHNYDTGISSGGKTI